MVAAAAATLWLSGATAQTSGDGSAVGVDAAGPEPLISIDGLRLQGPGLLSDPGVEALSNAHLARSFQRVVFDVGAARVALSPSELAGSPTVAKWVDPVAYRVVGDGAQREDTVAAVLLAARIEETIALEIRPAIGGRPANLTVFILSEIVRANLREQLEAALEAGEIEQPDPLIAAWLGDQQRSCASNFRRDPLRPGAILEAIVLIKAEADPQRRALCLRRDMLRSFGLPNLHEDVAPSILNPLEAYAEPTEHDFWLLRLLYDPRLLPGARRDETVRLTEAILAELRPEGEGDGRTAADQTPEDPPRDDVEGARE